MVHFVFKQTHFYQPHTGTMNYFSIQIKTIPKITCKFLLYSKYDELTLRGKVPVSAGRDLVQDLVNTKFYYFSLSNLNFTSLTWQICGIYQQ